MRDDPTTNPVEITTRYVTTVADISGAWAFVMERVDRVGPRPRIQISPITIFNHDGDEQHFFEVTVEGMVTDAE